MESETQCRWLVRSRGRRPGCRDPIAPRYAKTAGYPWQRRNQPEGARCGPRLPLLLAHTAGDVGSHEGAQGKIHGLGRELVRPRMGNQSAGAGTGWLELDLGAVRGRDRADALPDAPNERSDRSDFERHLCPRRWHFGFAHKRGLSNDTRILLEEPGDKSELPDRMAHRGL